MSRWHASHRIGDALYLFAFTLAHAAVALPTLLVDGGVSGGEWRALRPLHTIAAFRPTAAEDGARNPSLPLPPNGAGVERSRAT